MKLNLKKLLTFLPVFVILAAFTSLGTVQADASQYYYFKEPTGKVSYKVGDKVPVTFMQAHAELSRHLSVVCPQVPLILKCL